MCVCVCAGFYSFIWIWLKSEIWKKILGFFFNLLYFLQFLSELVSCIKIMMGSSSRGTALCALHIWAGKDFWAQLNAELAFVLSTKVCKLLYYYFKTVPDVFNTNNINNSVKAGSQLQGTHWDSPRYRIEAREKSKLNWSHSDPEAMWKMKQTLKPWRNQKVYLNYFTWGSP